MVLLKDSNSDHKILKALLTTGAVLACTPPNFKRSFKPIWLRKVYALVILVTVCTVASLAVFRKSKLLQVSAVTRLAANFSEEVLLGIFACSIVMKSNFTHAKVWATFLKKLKRLDKHFFSSNNDKKRIVYFIIEVLVYHIIFISMYIYEIYFDINRYGANKTFKVLVYYFYFILYLAHHIVKLLRRYLEDLHTKLTFIHKLDLHEPSKVDWFRQLGGLYVDVIDLISDYNAIFGWHLFLAIIFTTIVIANDVQIQIFRTRFYSEILDRIYFGYFPLTLTVSKKSTFHIHGSQRVRTNICF